MYKLLLLLLLYSYSVKYRVWVFTIVLELTCYNLCLCFVFVTGRVFDPNKHCGVQDPETKRPCTRSLTCKVTEKTHTHTQTHTLTHLASPYHSSGHNNSFWPHFLLPVCACVDEISGIKRTPCLTVCPCDNCVLHFSPGVEHLRGVYFPWCFNNSGRRLPASLCSDTQLHCPLITRDTLRSSLKSGY